MIAYIIRRLLFMVPTLLGMLFVVFIVVQFAPGGPVERMIAVISGTDTGAGSRLNAGGDFAGRGPGQTGDSFSSKYPGARGIDEKLIKQLEEQFELDKPAY